MLHVNTDEQLQPAAKILLRYTRGEKGVSARLKIISDKEEQVFSCSHDFDEEDVERYRI